MTDLATYDRSAHDCACPCKDCIAFDCALAMQTHGEYFRAAYNAQNFQAYLARERSKNLNWNFEPRHCILCGGTVMSVYVQAQHYEVKRHNNTAVNGELFTSWLIVKDSAMWATYQIILRSQDQKSRPLKTRLIEWVCSNLELNPEKCTKLASRMLDGWLEIRLGFSELQDEPLSRRYERIRANSPGRRKDGAGDHSATGAIGKELQGTFPLAR